MSSERAISDAAVRMPADLPGRDRALSFAGLLDVLDRADGAPVRQRPRPGRAAHRTGGPRSGAVRSVPLRSVRPAPPARPLLGSNTAPAERDGSWSVSAAPTAAPGRLRAFTRRLALWGAGPQGEYLAWRVAASRPTPPRPASALAPVSAAGTSPTPVLREAGWFSALIRRAALWGAGAQGEYLAWPGTGSAPAPQPAHREVDGPVLLRELPSTPTVQPVAPSPATALPGPRVVRPTPAGRSVHPTGWPPRHAWPPVKPLPTPSTSRSGSPGAAPVTGVARSSSPSNVPAGLVRARGDPSSCRGSPEPLRRSRTSPSSTSIPLPARATSPPRWAPAAPG